MFKDRFKEFSKSQPMTQVQTLRKLTAQFLLLNAFINPYGSWGNRCNEFIMAFFLGTYFLESWKKRRKIEAYFLAAKNLISNQIACGHPTLKDGVCWWAARSVYWYSEIVEFSLTRFPWYTQLKFYFRFPLWFLNIALNCVSSYIPNGSIELTTWP